jgi:hypothetical protein
MGGQVQCSMNAAARTAATSGVNGVPGDLWKNVVHGGKGKEHV